MINVLFLEDSNVKANNILNVLWKSNLLPSESIHSVSDITQATKCLQSTQYDVFIMDIELPQRFGENAKPEAGYDLLYRIQKKQMRMNPPKHIIAITAYKEVFEEYKKQFKDDAFFLIYYDESTIDWQNSLIKKLQYIVNAENNHKIQVDYDYDIAIICALSDPEFTFIEELPVKWEKITVPNMTLSFYSTIFQKDDKLLRVIAATTNTMGMVPTTMLATQMIELFRPRYITMTGIAAGIDNEEISLGDLLIIDISWEIGRAHV